MSVYKQPVLAQEENHNQELPKEIVESKSFKDEVVVGSCPPVETGVRVLREEAGLGISWLWIVSDSSVD